jgi:hypothetical protein
VSDGGDDDDDGDAPEDGDRRETGDLARVVAMSRNDVPATDDVCRDRPERNPVRVPSDGEHDALCSATAPNLDQLLVSVAVESESLVSPTFLALTFYLKHLHRAAHTSPDWTPISLLHVNDTRHLNLPSIAGMSSRYRDPLRQAKPTCSTISS